MRQQMDHAVLCINGLRGGTPVEIAGFLHSVEHCYSHLYALDLLVADTQSRFSPEPAARRGQVYKETLRLELPQDPGSILLPGETLYVREVAISSPGHWKFLGMLSPFETIRKYLKDRHERRKDNEYRNAAERDKLLIEIEMRRLGLFERRVHILKSLGCSESEIRAAANKLGLGPLGGLDKWQDTGLISDAEIESLDVASSRSAETSETV